MIELDANEKDAASVKLTLGFPWIEPECFKRTVRRATNEYYCATALDEIIRKHFGNGSPTIEPRRDDE